MSMLGVFKYCQEGRMKIGQIRENGWLKEKCLEVVIVGRKFLVEDGAVIRGGNCGGNCWESEKYFRGGEVGGKSMKDGGGRIRGGDCRVEINGRGR